MPWHQVTQNPVREDVGKRTGELIFRNKPSGWILDDPDVNDQIIRMARRLRRRCRHSPSDLEDLEQDIRLYLIMHEHKYDALRGSVGGFAFVLLDSYLKMQIRARQNRLRRGRLPSTHLIGDLDYDTRVDPRSAWDDVELRDLLEACFDRISTMDIRMLALTCDVGQVRACESMDMSRRKLRNLLKLVMETCADLDPYSE